MLLLNIFHVHLILYLHVYTHKYVFPNTYMLQGFVYENKFVLYTLFCIFNIPHVQVYKKTQNTKGPAGPGGWH